jgi:NodT family efflux transporter outer membrane factor (OMF) lipoprotein
MRTIAVLTRRSSVDRRTQTAEMPGQSMEPACTVSLEEWIRMILTRKSPLAYFSAISALLLTAACAVGPKFNRPAPPDVGGYTPTPISTTISTANVAGGEAQHVLEGGDIPGEWWTLFHSKPLNDLIERSLKANPDLKAAQAALIVARENVLAQRGAYYPGVTGGFSGTRAKTSSDISPVTNTSALNYSLYTPQVNVSFVPDVFGLNRRTVESLKAQAQQARYALAATHITLSANVAAGAIQEASLRAQIAATRELITINTDMLEILRTQYVKGYASRLDVAAQESQLAQVAATLPPLLKQLAQQRDLLAVLSGAFPNQDLAEKFELSSLQLPQELPVSLPSQLVEQRPDVRQAEENLHSASALIGIAAANRLPSFALTADAGSMAVVLGKIFTGGTGFWDIGASVTQPIFEGGTLLHRERAAKAAYTQASEQYRSTVLTAFQNVADTLNALQQDADALKAAAASKDAATVTLELARKQFQAGYVSYLSLLSSEQAYQQAVINLVQAQANRYADTAALFQALGGGWWNQPDIPKN